MSQLPLVRLLAVPICTVFLFRLAWAAPETDKPADLTKLQSSGGTTISQIQIRPLQANANYQDSTALGALDFACSKNVTNLRAFLETRELPFQADLVHNIDGQKCHIYYEPTLKGFRADPDDFPIDRLLFEYATVRFIAKKSFEVGDGLDIIRSIVDRLDTPPRVQIGLQYLKNDVEFQNAKEIFFGNKAGQVDLIDRRANPYMPWVQDYVKSGRVGAAQVILVPYRLYEGRTEAAVDYQNLLDTLVEDRNQFQSSKIAWEGGDLQFVLHPKDAQKLILFYGNGARDYWSPEVTSGEYAYVLRQEFGGDVAIDLSNMAPHVDYFVSFIPSESIALVSEPLHSDLQLAREALESLIQKFEQFGTPPDELEQLRSLLGAAEPGKYRAVSELMDRIWEIQNDWSLGFDTQVMERVSSYVSHSCGSEMTKCLSIEGQLKLAHEDLDLLKDWVTVALQAKSDRQLIVSHLAIIESQLAKPDKKKRKQLEEKIGILEELGFSVIRVPMIRGTSPTGSVWPGISYVNGLLLEKKFFVPNFGLGQSEVALMERLASQLPASYSLVPVYAQHSLVHNGGIHCVSGIIRGLPDSHLNRASDQSSESNDQPARPSVN